MIRCVIVDDSPSFRAVLRGILAPLAQVQIVGEAADGAEAVELAEKLRPDVITIDVHMPRQNGLQAIEQIMARAPAPIVVIGSSAADPAITFQALALGAVEVLAKPAGEGAAFEAKAEQIRLAVRVLAGVKVVTHHPQRESLALGNRAPRSELACLGIVTSTGGPAALEHLLARLPADFAAPILVVQHIQAGFLAGLVRWLDQQTSLRVKIAEAGEPVERGTVYFAPDGQHLLVARGTVQLDESAPVRGFRPSGTALLAALAKEYGPAAAGLVLTGMGDDGVAGLKLLRARGGFTLAQGQASSVVYGMPRAAVQADAVELTAELEQLPDVLCRLAARDKAAPGKRRLLLVDDTESILALEEKLFGREYELYFARNGREALEQAEKLRPDAILMDYSMPVMTGGEALRAMRESPLVRHTPIVMVTSESDPALLRGCWESGCTALVKKPIDSRLLLETVRNLVPAPPTP